MPEVADIIRMLEHLAPRRLAEDWDNVGLQFGDPGWTADHIFVALDPTPGALDAAAAAGADMLVTHHPLIFKPLKSIDVTTPIGRMIDLAARKRIALFAAHTNLDSAAGGVNDVLARKIGLSTHAPLSPAIAENECKLVVFVPSRHADKVLDALSDTPAGSIGNYTSCSFHQAGRGRFKPDPSATPLIGTVGKLNETEEVRIETRVKKADLNKVLSRIRLEHPYETMAYDVYPLELEATSEGIGRLGSFDGVRRLADVAEDIKQRLGLTSVKFAGSPEMPVQTAAVCSGSGSGLLKEFLASDAQVYISGDLNHHAAIDTAVLHRGMIDIGHFASEQLIVPVLGRLIEERLAKNGFSAQVSTWAEEPDPFTYI